MRTVWIYTLADPITLHIKYVGKSYRIARRLRDHLQCQGNNKKDAWIKSLLKKGLKPLLEIIEETDDENCNLLEQYWIEQFRAWDFDLKNMTKGGDGSYGLIPWNKGLKGVFSHSQESKNKMSADRKGKFSGNKNPMYGKRLSSETIRKQIEKRLGSKRSEETKKLMSDNSPNTKEIFCYTLDKKFVKKYRSGKETVKDGFDWNIVSKVCRGINKTHKNHLFYFNELKSS